MSNLNHLLNPKDVWIALRPHQLISDNPLGVYTPTILHLTSFDICRGFFGIPEAATTRNTPFWFPLVLPHPIVCILCLLRPRDQNFRADSRRRLARLVTAEKHKSQNNNQCNGNSNSDSNTRCDGNCVWPRARGVGTSYSYYDRDRSRSTTCWCSGWSCISSCDYARGGSGIGRCSHGGVGWVARLQKNLYDLINSWSLYSFRSNSKMDSWLGRGLRFLDESKWYMLASTVWIL